MSKPSEDLPELHKAVVENDIMRLKRLLATKLHDFEQLAPCSIFITPTQGTPLHFAAAFGNIPAADTLLSSTADINSKAEHDCSPVHWACVRGQDKMVAWLIECGANINQTSVSGTTPLYFAALNGNVAVAEILLLQKVDTNVQNDNRKTALHAASKKGHREMVKLLLDHDANALIQTETGDTALDFAQLFEHAETMHLIQTTINNGNVQREILLNKESRSRTNSNDSIVSGYLSQATIEQSYDMHKSVTSLGFCVIINNEDFTRSVVPMNNRDASQGDKAKLCKQFEMLGLNVHCYDNLKADGMRRCLSHYSGLDHGEHRCFICCILSHGEEGKIYGVDGEFITPLEATSGFVAAKCPSLKEKPKAFVIVACKGKEQSEADDDGNSGATNTKTSDAIGMLSRLLTPPPSPSPQRETSENISPSIIHISWQEKHFLPVSEEDFLLAFSTIPGHVSYRNTNFGTMYVNCLTQNLAKYGEKYCFSEILRNTEKHLAKRNIHIDSKVYKQVCLNISTLTKKFVLSGEGLLTEYDKNA